MLLHNIATYIKDSLINKSLKVLLLRVAGVFFFFTLSIFLTNFYNPELVGRYDFTRATLLILGGICMLGTNQAIIYYSGELTARNALGELRQIYKKMVGIILLTWLCFILIASIVPNEIFNNFFEKEDAASLLFKVVISLGAFAITMLNIDTLRALKHPLFSELYRNIFRYLPFFFAAIILFYTQQTKWLVEAYLLGFLVLAVISTIQVLIFFRKNTAPKTNNPITYKNILRKSSPMALSAVTFFLMQSTDIILLGKFTDFVTVAYYAVAVKLATATALALQSVNVIIAPKIAEVFVRKDISELKKIIKNSTRLIFILSIPALIILGLFASFFLNFFGSEYVAAKSALLILLAGQFFNTLCGPVGIYMNMTGRQGKLQQILLVGFITNLLLNWILIPKYGMIGAATATAISMVLWNLIAVLYAWKKDRVKTFLS